MIRLLVVVALVACTTPKPPPGAAGPVEAVQAFSDALQKGDTATAWSLLSERTQREADAAAAKARASAGDAGPASGREMLFGSAIPAGSIEPRLVSQSNDSAEVQTSSDAGTRTFRVVRENGRWRVDLALGR